MRRMAKGTKVSAARTVGIVAYLAGFSAYAVLNSFVIGVPVVYGAAYAAIFGALAYYSYRYSSNLVFWRALDGSIHAKGGTAIYIFYIAALLARILVSYALTGSQEFFVNPIVQTVEKAAPETIMAAAITDGLLMVAAGLLVGRNAMLLRRFKRIKSGKETVQEL